VWFVGAVISFAARRKAVRCGASAGRPAHGAGCPAVLGVEAPPSNSLRARWALRSDSDGELVHEARCARGPRPLRSSATLRRAATHHLPPRGLPQGRAAGPHTMRIPTVTGARPHPSRRRGPGGRDVGSGEKRSGRVGARSAHPKLTRRRCLSGAAKGREASSTARPGREHRSGVGPQADRSRRPCTQATAVARRAPHMPLMPRA
jgi:hypothetical protein